MRRALVLAVLVAMPAGVFATPASTTLAAANDAPENAPDDAARLASLTTEPVARTESSGFGWRADPIRRRAKFHHGTDYRGKRGTPVVAAGSGVVTFAGRRGGYGKVVFVDHGGGVVTRYAHLQKIEVKEGAVVDAGGRVGQLGSSGRTTGPHLHFEVRLDGRAVDPVTAFAVAALARENLEAARLAAHALSPELQAQIEDPHDPPKSRPERKRAPKRSQHLW